MSMRAVPPSAPWPTQRAVAGCLVPVSVREEHQTALLLGNDGDKLVEIARHPHLDAAAVAAQEARGGIDEVGVPGRAARIRVGDDPGTGQRHRSHH